MNRRLRSLDNLSYEGGKKKVVLIDPSKDLMIR